MNNQTTPETATETSRFKDEDIHVEGGYRAAGLPIPKRGFAAQTPEQQRENARKGGKAAHEKGTAHEFTPEEARKAGSIGGKKVSQDPRYMAYIGSKGGKAVSRNSDHMRAIGRKGGQTVARDRAHMQEIGRKGGISRGVKANNG